MIFRIRIFKSEYQTPYYIELYAGSKFSAAWGNEVNNIYGLLTKCEVKMAGYWPSSFFVCVYGPRRTCKKKNEANIQPSLLNKGFMIWFSGKFFLRDVVGSPKHARWLHLPCSGSWSHCVMWFILPPRGASHVITLNISLTWLCVFCWFSCGMCQLCCHKIFFFVGSSNSNICCWFAVNFFGHSRWLWIIFNVLNF